MPEKENEAGRAAVGESGRLRIMVTSSIGMIPVQNARITISYKGVPDITVVQLDTDNSGQTETIDLPSPPIDYSMEPGRLEQPYSEYNVRVEAEGYEPVEVSGTEILPEVTAWQNVEMNPSETSEEDSEIIVIPEHTLYGEYPPKIEEDEIKPIEEGEIVLSRVVIPEYIVVHDGVPDDSTARNYYVRYRDYIKNVASSEIYPTWSPSAIRANVLAQISYALNRVYLEHYRSRGYDFDITNSTAIDQSFVNGRNTFESIDNIVNEIFDTYIRRQGFIEPLAAKYCNGTTSTCEGLSQWGSEDLARQGYNSVEILRNYYGGDIELVSGAPVRPVRESYPGYPLRVGSSGEEVVEMQAALNRIARNYPGIPRIDPVDGVFGAQTEEAVRTFQSIFDLSVDGIIGRATWYKVILVYTGVTRLAELNSEGQRFIANTGQASPGQLVSPGDTGELVDTVQYYINVLSQFYSSIPPVAATGVYDSATQNSVAQAQMQFGITQTGTVDYQTWNAMESAVVGIGNTIDGEAG